MSRFAPSLRDRMRSEIADITPPRALEAPDSTIVNSDRIRSHSDHCQTILNRPGELASADWSRAGHPCDGGQFAGRSGASSHPVRHPSCLPEAPAFERLG